MKKFLFCFVIAGVAMLTACEKEKEPSGAPKSLTVDQTSIDVRPEGGTTLISVSTGSSWTATADVDWVKLSPASGNSSELITVEIDGHLTARRNATVNVTSGGITKTVTIKQRGQAPLLQLPQSKNLWATRYGGNIPVAITSNIDWSATTDADWITLNPSSFVNNDVTRSNIMIMEVASNTGLLMREGKIYINANDQKDSLMVSQMGTRIINSDNFVTATLPFRETGPYVPCAVDWLRGEITTLWQKDGIQKFGVLAYEIIVPSSGRLKIIDHFSPTHNLWYLMYDNFNNVGNYYESNGCIAQDDGTMEYDVHAGTYYILALLNYWYEDIAGREKFINYDIEITLN